MNAGEKTLRMLKSRVKMGGSSRKKKVLNAGESQKKVSDLCRGGKKSVDAKVGKKGGKGKKKFPMRERQFPKSQKKEPREPLDTSGKKERTEK